MPVYACSSRVIRCRWNLRMAARADPHYPAFVMKTPRPLLRRTLAILVSLVGLLFAGCDYDVPLSDRPERPVDDQLAGNWMSPDAWMMVRRFDAENYVVVHNGSMFRAWHSKVAGR